MALPLQRLPKRASRTLPGGTLRKFLPGPHYSWALLLQSPIRCYDEPSACGLAPRTLTVLHGVRIGSSRLRAPVSRRGSAISPRTVMNNAG